MIDVTKPTECPVCGQMAVSERVVRETAEISFDGASYTVSADVPALICGSCGERFLDYRGDRELRRELRKQLRLLQPEEIKSTRESFDLTQEDVAQGTGIAATTISRWEQSHVIQSRASDDHLRRFFDDMEQIHAEWDVFTDDDLIELSTTSTGTTYWIDMPDQSTSILYPSQERNNQDKPSGLSLAA